MIEPRFVDRFEELKALEELAKRGSPSIIYIYGPEGCGKTRLLKEFIKKFNGVGIYIDSLEEESIEKALIFTQKLNEVKSLLLELTQQATGPIGKWLTSRLLRILKKIVAKIKIEDEHLVIVIDDITRARGLNDLERYIKWLYELQWKIYKDYRPRTILTIATTSEGYSLSRIIRHTYNIPNLIWNLEKEAYEELIHQLKPPNREIVEKIWRLTGGNPRQAIEIAITHKWKIEEWLIKTKNKLGDIANILKAKNLIKETHQLIEDPDTLYKKPTIKLREAYEILLEHNLMMYVGISLLTSWTHKDKNKWITKPSRELGIGRYYAWQIPAYKQALKQLL